LDEYFAVIERERRRAWRKYNMLVMTGIEFNKDGYTQKTSAHLLGIDLKAPIPSALDLPETSRTSTRRARSPSPRIRTS
jgi:processive 1,2-diacylglycerol beta-glucosyltransferase